jgi:hypothetical protein
MGDKPLDRAIILDTEYDIGTKLIITCSCGVDLEVSQIRDEPEQPITLVVHACENCIQINFERGCSEGGKRMWSGL